MKNLFYSVCLNQEIFLNATVSQGDVWVRDTIVDLNKNSLQKTNSEYLKTLGTIAGKRHLLKNLV